MTRSAAAELPVRGRPDPVRSRLLRATADRAAARTAGAVVRRVRAGAVTADASRVGPAPRHPVEVRDGQGSVADGARADVGPAVAVAEEVGAPVAAMGPVVREAPPGTCVGPARRRDRSVCPAPARNRRRCSPGLSTARSSPAAGRVSQAALVACGESAGYRVRSGIPPDPSSRALYARCRLGRARLNLLRKSHKGTLTGFKYRLQPVRLA